MPSSQALSNLSAPTQKVIASTANSSGQRSLPVDVSIAFHRFHRWLAQLQKSVDAVCDDAYVLDRLILQGVLPLRQHSGASPTAAQNGLKAAVYELLVGAAERERVEVQKARQHHRAWKLTGTAQGRPGDKKAATYSHFRCSSSSAAANSDVTDAAIIAHNSTPPCPCCVFLAQQHMTSGEQRSHSSGHSSEDDDEDCGEGNNMMPNGITNGARHRHSNHDKHVVAANYAANSTPGSHHESPHRRQSSTTAFALSASFPARLKDAVRVGSGTAMAQTVTAHSSHASRKLSSVSGTSSSREHENSTLSRFGSRGQSAEASKAAAPQLLLPVTTVSPVCWLSAAASTDEEGSDNENDNGGDDDEALRKTSDATSNNKSAADAVSMLAAVTHPIPVGSDTMPSRTLHSFWSHVMPEDVRRCFLCSGQLLFQGCWHALYLLQLLTMLSAVPAMVAPLPLPPPTVLKTQPVEALLLLLQTAQRCFVAGLTLTAAVSTPCWPSSSSQRNDLKETCHDARGQATHTAIVNTSSNTTASNRSALDVLRGGHGGGTAAQSPPVSAFLASSSLTQQQSKEDQMLSSLAISILGVVDAIGGVAAPVLWPHKPVCYSSASSAAAVPAVSSPHSLTDAASTEKCTLLDLRGDVLALRFRVFYGAFLILMAHNGADRGTAALAAASVDILTLLTAVHGAQPHDSSKTSKGGLSDIIYLNMMRAFALLVAPRGNPAARAVVENISNINCGDDLVVLDDDLRALCCVVALLNVFADVVRAQEDGRSSNVSSTAGDFHLSDSATHLIDAIVFPALVALQNSSRGNCSAQARPLLALWWLLRAETVRQLADTAKKTQAVKATVRVLEREVSLMEDDNSSSSSDEGQSNVGVMHWSGWLKEASRAAVRASNAASEFLGLTFLTASPFGFSSPLTSSSRDCSLRWRLPLELPPHGGMDVACLPLAWVRMWLLLCPPLFHISPTNALALQHTVQQQQQQQLQRKLAKERKDAAAACEEEESSMAASTLHTGKSNGKAPPRGGKSSRKSGGKSGESAKTASKAGGQDLSTQKCECAVVGKRRGNNSEATSSPGLNQAEIHLRDADVLQLRLQISTEPTFFWVRWCQLFLPAPPTSSPPSSSSQRQEGGEEDRSSKKAEVSPETLSPVAAAVADAIALLRNPSLASSVSSLPSQNASTMDVPKSTHNSAAPPLSTTQLVRTLQSAFPLMIAQDLVRALEAQSQLFLASEAYSTTTAATMARATACSTGTGNALFAPYSFVSSLTPLREVVSTFYHNFQAASLRTAPPSPPRASSLPICVDDKLLSSSTTSSPLLKSDGIHATAPQPTRAGIRRPPLMATCTMPRRGAGKGKSSSPPPPQATGTDPAAPTIAATADDSVPPSSLPAAHAEQ